MSWDKEVASIGLMFCFVVQTNEALSSESNLKFRLWAHIQAPEAQRPGVSLSPGAVATANVDLFPLSA